MNGARSSRAWPLRRRRCAGLSGTSAPGRAAGARPLAGARVHLHAVLGTAMKRLLGQSALLFMAIALALYAALYVASEQLLRRNGHSNPLFKIANCAKSERRLGRCSARRTRCRWISTTSTRASSAPRGQRIVQLAAPGTGPLYNRFVFEHFLHRHNTRNLLYVVDAFAFYSRTWNEDRFSDAKLLRRTPWDAALAARLARYVRDEGVEVGALLDLRQWFFEDQQPRALRARCLGRRGAVRACSATGAWRHRPSASPTCTRTRPRLRRWRATCAGSTPCWPWRDSRACRCWSSRCRCRGNFVSNCPTRRPSTRRLAHVLAAHGARLADLSAAIDDPRSYFDTDHLNRAGLQAFIDRSLTPLLVQRVP